MVRMEEITTDLWRPQEIAKRIASATTRQITDLASRGIATPVVDTTGGGVSRIYNYQGIYEIMLGLSLRGSMPFESQKHIIKLIVGFEFQDNVPEACIIKHVIGETFNVVAIPDSNTSINLQFLISFEPRMKSCNSPKNFVTHFIDLNSMKLYLKQKFCIK